MTHKSDESITSNNDSSLSKTKYSPTKNIDIMSTVKGKEGRIFSGWWTVLAAGVIGLWGWGSCMHDFYDWREKIGEYYPFYGAR